MEALYKAIIGHEKVTNSFGHWPSFHDSEVVSVRLDRDEGKICTGPVLTVSIHLFRLEVAADDPNRNNTVTTVQFREVEELKMTDFNHQNAISDLVLFQTHSDRLKKDIFAVEFRPGFGMSCSLKCGEIEVLSVEPFTPKWGAWAT